RMGDVNGDWEPEPGGKRGKDLGRDLITLAFPDTLVELAGTPARLPLTVTEFDSIGAVSLRITFADSVLQYAEVISHVPGVTFLTNLVGDEIRIEWYDMTGGANPIIIGTDTLLAVEFDLVGNPGETSPLHFQATCAIGDPQGDPLENVVYIDGSCMLGGGSGEVTDPREEITRYDFHPVQRDPSAKQVVFVYDLPVGNRVSMQIYDVGGRLVTCLVDEVKPVGRHKTTWRHGNTPGHRVPTGIYFAHLRAGSFSQTRKFLIAR
ncbi:MAG: hypothetical protein KAY24_18550, partial [Candidatus Eisenbacteria sp.]|nr:hypothetical protein [Candidatus Eisenbacteria bacterium]